ncbi:MAG: alpha/beta hydrolase [Bacteroidales bacterium]|nr:alpha/beta hydrolase [Bacteroidales bacterium]
MIEKTHPTTCGEIHYWTNNSCDSLQTSSSALIFLPGLTADHRLFEQQIAFFEQDYRVLVWDAPAHAASWPFDFSFTLKDKAIWLDEILQKEHIEAPVIVGQSMGGYVGQMYAQLFPDKLRGFISIDSAPLQREYVTALEIWLLKRMEPVYRYYPWKSLLKLGSNGVSTSAYGRALMRDIMMHYDSQQDRYAKICGHGYRMLAEAMEADLPYEIKCPALLICGEKDHAGSCIGYNKRWHKKSGIPLIWIKNAGHNANTDAPALINQLIQKFLEKLLSL